MSSLVATVSLGPHTVPNPCRGLLVLVVGGRKEDRQVISALKELTIQEGTIGAQTILFSVVGLRQRCVQRPAVHRGNTSFWNLPGDARKGFAEVILGAFYGQLKVCQRKSGISAKKAAYGMSWRLAT